jgi:hypothetical protein
MCNVSCVTALGSTFPRFANAASEGVRILERGANSVFRGWGCSECAWVFNPVMFDPYKLT